MTAILSSAEATIRPQLPGTSGAWLRLIRIEIRRTLRNRRALVFCVVMPVFFYLMFSRVQPNAAETLGRGTVGAWLMVNLALFGAIGASATGGAAVSIEREHGWTRQLRLTPLGPLTWILTKAIGALVGALVAAGAVFMAGAASGARMVWWAWPVCLVAVLVLSLVFSIFGVMVAYLVPSENSAQILAFANTALAFAGGLFVPLPAGSSWELASRFTPMWGVRMLASSPLDTGPFPVWAVVNVVAWVAGFAVVAMWRMSRDTSRR